MISARFLSHLARVRLAGLLFALAGLSLAAHAQSYEQVAPKTLESDARPVLPDAPTPKASDIGASDQVLLPALRGLVFLAGETAFARAGVDAPGLHVPASIPIIDTPDFRALVDPWLGQPLSMRSLDRLTREVVLYFRTHGRPVVDVFVPEQSISAGTVQIIVIEGRLGTVTVEGNSWFSNAQVTSSIRAAPGEVIEGGPLLADMQWINQNPFRQVDLVFTRGVAAGETDLVLRMRDRRPVRFYTGYEDSGNALTGFDRVLAGVNLGNAFGHDHLFNYQFSASPDLEKLVAHSASYIVPLPGWRHTLTVFGSHAESRPELAGGLFDLRGDAWQISARYKVPLAASAVWTRDLTVGVDFKRSNNDLAFGGTQVFAQETDVVQAIAAFNTTHTDKYGTSAGALTVAVSPGGLTGGNHASNYRAARAGAQPDYVYARLDLERYTKLSDHWSWLARGTAQFSSANLLGSEQLGLGGSGGLRGYEEREANGDNGFLLVNELHGPSLHLARRFRDTATNDHLDPLVFIDYGLVASHRRLAGEPDHLTLASAGLGFRYTLGRHFSLRADYGWQLKDSGVSDGRRGSRGHLSCILSY